MFIENNFAHPLFDFEKGGRAKAFECLMVTRCSVCLESPCTHYHQNSDQQCKKVTRTERGMRMHLKTVHNWKEQPCLFSMESPTAHGSQESRKQLRISPKPRKSGDAEPRAKTPTPETMHEKSPKTNKGDLLKLMSEGK